MPKRRYVWSHPFTNVYILKHSRRPVKVLVERRPSLRERQRPVFQWRLVIADVTHGVFRSMKQAEDAIPSDVVQHVA
jgi:hypothetical protein